MVEFVHLFVAVQCTSLCVFIVVFMAVLIGSWGCPNNQFGVYKRLWWSTSQALTGQRPNMRCVDISKRNYFSNHVFKQRGENICGEGEKQWKSADDTGCLTPQGEWRQNVGEVNSSKILESVDCSVGPSMVGFGQSWKRKDQQYAETCCSTWCSVKIK